MLRSGDDGRPVVEIQEEIYQGIIRAAIQEMGKLPAFRFVPSNKITTGDVLMGLDGAKDYLKRRMTGTDPWNYLLGKSSD